MEFLPRITPRVDGTESVAHHITATKAVEDAWGVEVPAAARDLRRLFLNTAQYTATVTHFFLQQAPDFLIGPRARPGLRNFQTVQKALPEIGTRGATMIRFGQDLVMALGGKILHPVTVTVGGFRQGLAEAARAAFRTRWEAQLEAAQEVLALGKQITQEYKPLVDACSTPTWYVGQTNGGTYDLYEGALRVMSPEGEVHDVPPGEYQQALAEHVVSHAFIPSCYVKDAGWPAGVYRAGSLARINLVDDMATPVAKDALREFRAEFGRPCHHTFAYLWARLIEVVAAIERIGELLELPSAVAHDPTKLMAPGVNPREGMGVGMTGSPCGPLVYEVHGDRAGICREARVLTAAHHNLAGIETSVAALATSLFEEQVPALQELPDNPLGAQNLGDDAFTGDLQENLLEMAVRCFNW